MFREASISILKPFHKVAEEGTFPYSPYEARITLIPKRDKGTQSLSHTLTHSHTHSLTHTHTHTLSLNIVLEILVTAENK